MHVRIRLWTVLIGFLGAFAPSQANAGRVEFTRDFAAAEGWVKEVEKPYRQEVCLNGLWQFQPVGVPAGWVRDRGIAPELPAPEAGRWERVPIKIPSPWNVNTWGAGRNVGAGSAHPYWPSSVYYPSYPPHWDGVEMGWLRRTFRVPEGWAGRRLVLHFEAVGGHAQVLVNGQKAGEHFDRFLPLELDITSLVRPGEENELLVGVRSMGLFDRKSAMYKLMRSPYPPGSTTDLLCGIWQDVFLLGLPAVRAEDLFVKPWVDRDTLEVEVAVRNDSGRERTVAVGGEVRPWVNLAGESVLDAPEPKWRLDPGVLSLAAKRVALKPGERRTITLEARVEGRLKTWSPETPNLYGAVVSLEGDGATIDRSYTRFGWRQFRIEGSDLTLNGQKVRMFGDLLHPFGPFVNSRRYVWAWYRMIKAMHGNAVRPHAQPHPRHYLDLADEMGLLVLDETAMFGSSLRLDFETPAAWERYAAHYDGLVLRDRNHPSVFGWSWGNELFAIFLYDKAITPKQADAWYGQLAELGRRGRRLDPTREWASCDGDEDLRGTLPVWSKHFGLGLPGPEALPKDLQKPLMVGESGGSYYAKAGQLAVFNGDRAYESYLGRNEALAIDVYDNVVHRARPELAFFSAAETAWFGLEHLGFGYRDATRLPDSSDGVWFPPFVEGKPGVQPERLPPYVCTLNPGWDPALPLYQPLPMFEAQKAAQVLEGPEPSPWDHRPERPKPEPLPPMAPRDEPAAFAGNRQGELAQRLGALGIALVDADAERSPGLLIVDPETLTESRLPALRRALEVTQGRRGTVLVMFRKAGGVNPALERLLPAPVSLTSRHATALVPRRKHAWTAGLGLGDLDFSGDTVDRKILKCGLEGPLVARGRVLLEASGTDWSQFDGAPEFAKCAAVVLYEKLAKPDGAALVEVAEGEGGVIVSTLDVVPGSKTNAAFWRGLFARAGVRVGLPAMAWLVPAGNSGTPGASWRYTFETPTDGWKDAKFDDRDWKTGVGGFGTPGVLNAKRQTPWETPEIWLRTTFDGTTAKAGDLKLTVYHDEDVDVYLNGVPALHRGGYVTHYESFDLPPEAARALRPKGNVLAVRCRQTAGEQFIDVGLGVPALSGDRGRPHNLLLDGPP